LIDMVNVTLGPGADAVPKIVRSGDLLDSFQGITLERVDRLLAEGNLRPPQLSLVRAGRSVPPAEYLSKLRYPYPGSPPADSLDLGRVVHAFRDGYTLMMMGCDRWLPELITATNSLRDYLRHPVLAVMFITPPNEMGLGIHADAFDNFVFQLEGTKEWEVFDRLPGHVPDGFLEPGQVGKPRLTTKLEPGDVLFMPYACPHVGHADSLSMHITIGIRTLTIRDLLGVILTRTDVLPAELEQTIPFAPWPPDGLGSVLGPGIAALLAELESSSWTELLSRAAGPEVPAWQPGALVRMARDTHR